MILKDIKIGNKYKAKFPVYCQLVNEEMITDEAEEKIQFINVESINEYAVLTLEAIKESFLGYTYVLLNNDRKQTLRLYYEQFINDFEEV